MLGLPDFGHTQRNCRHMPRFVACGYQPSLENEQPLWGRLSAVAVGATTWRSMKWKEAKVALTKRAPERDHRSAATGNNPAPKRKPTGHSAEQMDLDEGWRHVVQGGHDFNANTTSPNPKLIPQVTEEPTQPNVTAASNTPKSKRLEPKTTTAPKTASVKPTSLTVPNAKRTTVKHTSNKLVVDPHSINSPLYGIYDLIDQPPPQGCVELTRRLFTSISSLLWGPWG
jgi:hypothetical protein